MRLFDANNENATANHLINIQLSIDTLTSTVDEIGYVVTNVDDDITEITYDIISNNKSILFSTLENQDVTYITNIDGEEEGKTSSSIANQNILLGNDQQISFYRIKDSTFSDIEKTTDDSRFEFFKIFKADETENDAILTTDSGLKITLTESQSLTLNDLIGNLQSTASIFDFSSLPSSLGDSLEVTVQLAREADFNSIVGFYKVLDETGSVRDSLTGDVILPGDSEYLSIALEENNRISELANLQVADDDVSTKSMSITTENSLIAPYVYVENTKEYYFAFDDANSDGIKHIKTLGLNTFGLEDTNGGGDKDYDDLIFRLDFETGLGQT